MFKMADGCGEEASAQNNQNCLVEIWANKEILRQLSAMGRKQNIWENIAANVMTNASTMKQHNYTTMHEMCLKLTDIWCEQFNNKHVEAKHVFLKHDCLL